MTNIGVFEALAVILVLIGLWLLARTLRFPKSFFENQNLFHDVRRKLREQNKKEEPQP